MFLDCETFILLQFEDAFMLESWGMWCILGALWWPRIEGLFNIMYLWKELGNLGLKICLCKMVCLALKVIWCLGDLRVYLFEGLIGGLFEEIWMVWQFIHLNCFFEGSFFCLSSFGCLFEGVWVIWMSIFSLCIVYFSIFECQKICWTICSWTNLTKNIILFHIKFTSFN